jgi:hypothetical protein
MSAKAKFKEKFKAGQGIESGSKRAEWKFERSDKAGWAWG